MQGKQKHHRGKGGVKGRKREQGKPALRKIIIINTKTMQISFLDLAKVKMKVLYGVRVTRHKLKTKQN